MDLIYCDETNLEERSGDFFVYGGVIIKGPSAKELSIKIDELRRAAHVGRDVRLKFNPAPGNLTHQEFIHLKQEIVSSAVEHGAKLLVSVILHNVARGADEARRYEINRICYHFDCMQNREGQAGIVLIDRFSDSQIDAHLVQKFSTGVTGLPYSREHRLSNIVGFHYSAVGQSHFPSIIDIALGSLRYAINAFTRNDSEKLPTARRLLQMVAPLFYRQEWNNAVSELSFFFSPQIIRVSSYRVRYEALKTFLAEEGIVTAQEITNERQY